MEQASDDKDLQSDSPTISWPLNRSSNVRPINVSNTTVLEQPALVNPENLPGQQKALDGISIRAFLLGLSLGLSTFATVFLVYHQKQIWRVPFFLASLSLFHFLEYYITAAHNTRYANISAFLLFTNGKAYNIAHTAAIFECVVSSMFFSTWQSLLGNAKVICLGLVMMMVGQITRSNAMAHAGTNFNHTVQTRKTQGHELVTSGIYKYLRHPSYFGFFWWGVGTQVVLGNAVCFMAYTVILWAFFRKRITKEEEFLIGFFGSDYELYRSHTPVGIPFIR